MRAQIQRAAGLGLAVLLLLAVVATARPAVVRKDGAAKGKNLRQLNQNAWIIKTTNYGSFVYPEGSSSGGFWGGPGYGYIYGAGLWVGAMSAAGTPNVTLGYYPNNGGTEMGPVNPSTFEWANQSVDTKARVYLSTDPNDLADWPVKDAENANIVKSIQDGYAVYSDENPAFTFTGETKVGVRVKQFSYCWNYADNNDIVFFYFRVFNVSNTPLTGVYIGPCFDADIGDESGTGANDRTDFDYTRNLAIQYQTDPEPGWPKVGYFGCRYFESPRNNTGAPVNVVDLGTPNYSHSIPDTMPLGMTAFRIFTIDIDPTTDADRYLVMQGYNYKTMVMDAYDETGSATPGDKRFVMASGPFNMAAGDSVATCLGVMCALSRNAVFATSDVAQEIYDNDFELATPPTAPVITLTPSDKAMRISWGRVSETTADPYYVKIDSTKQWYTYFPGTWALCPDVTPVDSLKLYRTTDSSTVVIARGAANPANCTDTLYCLYNQRAYYVQNDFQAYIVYRAKTQAELTDPAKRQALGGLVTNAATGAASYAFDKKDGYQIVRDLGNTTVVTPGGTYVLPKYDTLGTDRGLIYTLVDNDVVNNFGWWYGVSAVDYQPNVVFTRKCPTTLASNPASTAKFGAAMAYSSDYKPAAVSYTTTGGASARSLDGSGTMDYGYELFVSTPNTAQNTSYTVRWSHERKVVGTNRHPFFKGKIYDAANNYVDSTGLLPAYALLGGSDPANTFYGSSDDQSTFGGVVFRPYFTFKPWLAAVDSFPVITEVGGGTRTYPVDSVRVKFDPNTWRADVGYWMWRGSDYEIRWRDTLVRIGAATADSQCLTCTVWDVTNNVEVPFEGGLAKNAMTKSGWCFRVLTGASGTDNYIYNRSSTDNVGMYIAGLTVFFRRATPNRMVWSMRPETGAGGLGRDAGLPQPLLHQPAGQVHHPHLHPVRRPGAGAEARDQLQREQQQREVEPADALQQAGGQRHVHLPCRRARHRHQDRQVRGDQVTRRTRRAQ
ncbi:MAG: hypothetical protein MUF78_08215 [Candidatus Edwardsbacteria bacterium]|nr:hypothetical protein [Candidatus Edwardsbacteria bacterium]